MSKIKLKHSSGNSMSIGAPATDPGGDLEIKLPATIGTNGQYLTVDGSGNLTWADPPGITELDQWRLITNVTMGPGAGVLASSWERNDTNFEKIGTGMTESSGIFTFPSTGKWEIDFRGIVHDTDDSRYAGCTVDLSTNNGSNYSTIAESWDGIFDKGSDTTFGAFGVKVVVDVTSISSSTTFKVRFQVDVQNEAKFNGSTNGMRTGATFKRLGGT